jgi:hypothetical protein
MHCARCSSDMAGRCPLLPQESLAGKKEQDRGQGEDRVLENPQAMRRQRGSPVISHATTANPSTTATTTTAIRTTANTYGSSE